jgi:hypothetical protein
LTAATAPTHSFPSPPHGRRFWHAISSVQTVSLKSESSSSSSYPIWRRCRLYTHQLLHQPRLRPLNGSARTRSRQAPPQLPRRQAPPEVLPVRLHKKERARLGLMQLQSQRSNTSIEPSQKMRRPCSSACVSVLPVHICCRLCLVRCCSARTRTWRTDITRSVTIEHMLVFSAHRGFCVCGVESAICALWLFSVL